MKDDLIKHIKAKKFDYNKIKEDNIVLIQNPEEAYDINFIITARGRTEFATIGGRGSCGRNYKGNYKNKT